MNISQEFKLVAMIIIGILVIASIVGLILQKLKGKTETIANLNQRINAWWIIVGVLFVAFFLGEVATLVLFTIISFFAMKEFLTVTGGLDNDKTALFIAFAIGLPLQYVLLGLQWYGMFAIFIPVYVLAAISTILALRSNTENFLQRNAKINFAIMTCVFSISHAPALLLLEIPGWNGDSFQILFFFLFLVQINDVAQYIWGKLLGKHKLLEKVSPSKTVEGFIGGVITTAALGAALHSITPFSMVVAAMLGLLIGLLGTLGGLVMSAIKRSFNAKDWGNAIAGHGGYMDRVDSVAFAAPIFFHVVRYYYT